MMLKILLAVLGVVGGSVSEQALAQTEDPFYQGKAITLLIGSNPGEPWDTYGRVLARHLGKHIPGNPAIVPQNMPGAGGLVLLNHLYNRSERDGTVIGFASQTGYLEPLFGNDRAMFKADEFSFLGSINQDVYACVAWHTSKMQTLDDAMDFGGIIANVSAENNGYIFMRFMNELIGTKFTSVLGYPGGSEVYLSMERGETEGTCVNSLASIRSTYQHHIDDGSMRIFAQIGLEESDDLPGVPFVLDYVQTEADRQAFALVLAPLRMQRTVAGTPDMPEESERILREAFDLTMQDPEFLEETSRARLAVNPISGEEVAQIIDDIYATPADVVQRVIDIRSSPE